MKLQNQIMLQDGQLDSTHTTTHFYIEVNNQVVNLQCVDFQPLQMCTKFQFSGANGYSMVTGLLNNYHPTVTYLTPDYHTLSDDFRGNKS